MANDVSMDDVRDLPFRAAGSGDAQDVASSSASRIDPEVNR